MEFRSPWIHQLNKEREITRLTSDVHVDVAIIGGGIAGVSTAFFLLKYTEKKITIFEGGKLAHGATGHNAGQITSYFERPFHEIVQEFGLEKAIKGQLAVESGWQLLDEIYSTVGVDIPLARFQGHAGYVKFSRVLAHLKNDYYRKLGGLTPHEFLISEEADFLGLIPKEYADLYKIVTHQEILERLETQDRRFIACTSSPKGCMNSALFCQEVVAFLLKNYPRRFSLFEHTHINKVVLHHEHVLLDAEYHTVSCDQVVLCTNGFENFHIINESGLDIDTRFHHKVGGVVGFMSGYLDKLNKPPTALSYYMNENGGFTDPYFYLTRRLYEYEGEKNYNLISVGGPELMLEDKQEYNSDIDYPEVAQKEIDEFTKTFYENNPNKSIDYIFMWHGVMGYTQNGLRLIGAEPKNKTLLYNLGCNGVGILPSIYGGKRISQIISGEGLEPSIFDPQEAIDS
jgi:glycine/D-amino acid oxidase-like deaminating enzyme